ncbi:unnamed protein product [Ectocarpus sp. 12 AP-2014]
MKAEKEIDGAIIRKMEKEDPRLYGITVDPVSDTQVELDSRKGRVVAAKRDGDGYLEFRVEVDGKQRKGKGTKKTLNTRQLLESAVGERIVRWEDEVKRMEKAFCSIFALVHVPVYKFVINDDKVKRKVNPVKLEGKERTEAFKLRRFAWDQINSARASEVINAHELGLLASDEELQRELQQDNSLVKVLNINLDTYLGLMLLEDEHEQQMDYALRHYSTVDHYIKGAQAAYKLGRVMSLETCMAPLSMGGDRDELPPGVNLPHV